MSWIGVIPKAKRKAGEPKVANRRDREAQHSIESSPTYYFGEGGVRAASENSGNGLRVPPALAAGQDTLHLAPLGSLRVSRILELNPGPRTFGNRRRNAKGCGCGARVDTTGGEAFQAPTPSRRSG